MENNRFKKIMGGEVGPLTDEDVNLFAPEQPAQQKDLLESIRSFKPDIQENDTTTPANNARNWLAGKVNPMLQSALGKDTSIQIPTMTVADEKNWAANLPENMAGAAMGSIGKVGPTFSVGKGVKFIDTAADRAMAAKQAKEAAGDFGKVITTGQQQAPAGFGKVTTKTTIGDEIVDATKANMKAGAEANLAKEATMKAKWDQMVASNKTLQALRDEAHASWKTMSDAERKAAMRDPSSAVNRYAITKQEMMNKVRGN